MDHPRELDQPRKGHGLLIRERATGVVAVARHDRSLDEPCERPGGRRPIERVGILERRHRSAFDQVAGEDDVGAGHRHDDVVVGMPTPEEAKLDRAPSDLDRCGRRNGSIGGIDDDLGEVAQQLGRHLGQLATGQLCRPMHQPPTIDMSPDLGRAEDPVAKGMVVVAMGVDHDRHGKLRELTQVLEDLATLGLGRSRIDHERRPVAQHDADVLVIERVASDEDAIADLDPGWHQRIVSALPDAYAAAMSSIVSRTASADGTELLVRHWATDDASAEGGWAGRPWAHVLLVHGLGEHSGRYEHVGDKFAASGLDTWAYDHRGNGGSGGRRGHVDRWSQLHDDLGERLGAVRQAAGERPVVLYGHSMGALIVLGYLLSDRPRPDLVVVASPALDSTLAGAKKALARVLGQVAPTLAIPNGVDGRTLSRDPGVAEKVRSDPACATSSTARFGAEGLAEQARVRREYHGLTLPMLVLHGLDDGLVPAAASEILAILPNAERRTYPGLRHELHNEPEGPQILDEVIAWIRERATIQPQLNTASGERLAR